MMVVFKFCALAAGLPDNVEVQLDFTTFITAAASNGCGRSNRW
jgi:hypothetical protein